ncbi:MAG TPA: tail fiber protein [Terracidiphilus sp.]|jgi:microcystin-dependent protein|nr:tail fiber protein [Terracidiphilus sp.]
MGQEYVGEVRLVGFNFAPQGWSTCSGQLISIAENSTLFNLIGTTYGGDGQQTFGIPNLQGRVPVHQGTGPTGMPYIIGQLAGTENVTVSITQYPSHTHSVAANSQGAGSVTSPNSNVLCAGQTIYRNEFPAVAMNAGMLSPDGGSQPHQNMQPFLVLNWVISLYGVYPSQS